MLNYHSYSLSNSINNPFIILQFIIHVHNSYPIMSHYNKTRNKEKGNGKENSIAVQATAKRSSAGCYSCYTKRRSKTTSFQKRKADKTQLHKLQNKSITIKPQTSSSNVLQAKEKGNLNKSCQGNGNEAVLNATLCRHGSSYNANATSQAICYKANAIHHKRSQTTLKRTKRSCIIPAATRSYCTSHNNFHPNRTRDTINNSSKQNKT